MFLHKLGHMFESHFSIFHFPLLYLSHLKKKKTKGLARCVLVSGFKKKSFPLEVRKVTWVNPPILRHGSSSQMKPIENSQGAQGLGKDSWGSKSLECRSSGPIKRKGPETKSFPQYSSCLSWECGFLQSKTVLNGHCCFCSSARPLYPVIYGCSRT